MTTDHPCSCKEISPLQSLHFDIPPESIKVVGKVGTFSGEVVVEKGPEMTTEQKKAEIADVRRRLRENDIDTHRLQVRETFKGMALSINTYWPWAIFFSPIFNYFPILGLLAPFLLLFFAWTHGECFQISAERIALKEESTKLVARLDALLAIKNQTKEFTVLEICGMVFVAVFAWGILITTFRHDHR